MNGNTTTKKSFNKLRYIVMIEKISIDKIFSNPVNPRVIKENKFKKLVKSIEEFPEMLKLRPIIINDEYGILGGNMRYKACKVLGLKEVWIIKANNLTDEQMKQFIIKDNSSFGEWDWDTLANMWDVEQLTDWGVNVYDFNNKDIDVVNQGDENSEWVGMPEFEASEKELKLVISFDDEETRQEYVEKNKIIVSATNKLTWSTHYPYRERNDLSSLKYE